MVYGLKTARAAVAGIFTLAASAFAGYALAGSSPSPADAVPILDQILRAPSHVKGLTDGQVAANDKQVVEIILKRQPKRVLIGSGTHCDERGDQYMEAASGLREQLKVLFIEEHSDIQDAHKAIIAYSQMTDAQKAALAPEKKKILAKLVEGLLDDTGKNRIEQCAKELGVDAAYRVGREEAARQIAMVVKYAQMHHTVIDSIAKDAAAKSDAAWAKYQATNDPEDYRAFVEVRLDQTKLAATMVAFSEKRGLVGNFVGRAHVEERIPEKPTTFRENMPDDGAEEGGTLSFVIVNTDHDTADMKAETARNHHKFVSADYEINLDARHLGIFQLRPPQSAGRSPPL